MKRSNKKGFTLVELVIVVAVIAILAGVLIPTIAGVVRRANTAADTAVAKEMNNVLAEYTAENDKPANIAEVVEILRKAGYDLATLNAKADGALYAWDKANNQIVYLDTKTDDGNYKVIYKNVDFENKDLTFVVADGSVALPEGSTSFDLATTEKYLVDRIADGGEVGIVEDIKLKGTAPAFNIVKDTTVDLGKATITVPNDKNGDGVFTVKTGATLTLKGDGVVNGVGDNGYNMALYAHGGKIIINGGTYTNVGATDEGDDNNHFDLLYVKYGGEIVINGGSFKCETPVWTLNSSDDYPGTIVVKGGEFFEFDPSNLPANLANDDITFDTNAYKVTTDVREDGTWYVVSAK